MAKPKMVVFSDVRGDAIMIPLSVLAVGTIFQSDGWEVVAIDGQIDEDWRNTAATHLRDATILGVTSHTGRSIAAVLELVRFARKHHPDVKIIWGGYHATQAFRAILKEGLVDYTVRGPGEPAAIDLGRAILDGKTDASDLESIPNLAFPRNPGDWDGEIVVTPFKSLKQMDALPPMDYGLLPIESYFWKHRRTIQYISSYGCPYACTFCAEPDQSARRWRGYSPERIVDDLVRLVEQYAPNIVSFVDPNFSSNPYRIVAFVEEMKRRSVRIPMTCNMRAADVIHIMKKMDLAELREVGMQVVFSGVETGSERMLKQLKKGSTVANVVESSAALDAAGIRVKSSFMHDLPGETEEDSRQTFELVEALCKLNNQQTHHFFQPFPATEIYDDLVASGALQKEDFTQDQWAETSTVHRSRVWAGRPDFRRSVHARLLALHQRYPASIPARIVKRLDEEASP